MIRQTIAVSGMLAVGVALAACESDRGAAPPAGGGGRMASGGMAPAGSASPSMGAQMGATSTLGAQLSGTANPSAKGEAQVMVDRNTKSAMWRVNYSGLSGPATMAHFHGPAAPGQNAPPVVWLSPQGQPVPSGTIEGRQQLNDQQIADLMAGRYYINIHTAANPNGEVRGQVLPR